MLNREEEILRDSLAKVRKVGKNIYLVFIGVTLLSIFTVIIDITVLVSGIAFESLESFYVGGVAYSLLQSIVMTFVYVLCLLTARDYYRGSAPFSKNQAKRIYIAAWIMAGFTALSFVWDPFVHGVLETYGVWAVGYSPPVTAASFYINFGALVATGVLFLFSYVLRYGEILQQFSDETL